MSDGLKILGGLVVVGLAFAWWGGIIWVAAHFISKFW